MIGDKLRELRIKKAPPKGLTQEEVAMALGIPRGTYAHYELNKREPDSDMIKKLADYFCVTTDEILGREVPAKPDGKKLSAKDQRDLDKFLQQSEVMFDGELHHLDDEGREMLRDALKYAFWQAKEKNKHKPKK